MRARAYAFACAATETKFDCREAKELFYTLQTNRMQREINDSV